MSDETSGGVRASVEPTPASEPGAASPAAVAPSADGPDLRRVLRVALVYLGVLAVACAGVALRYRLGSPSVGTVESVWSKGAVVRRSFEAGGTGDTLRKGETRVVERVIGESPILHAPSFLLAISLVPGRDGLSVRLGDRVEIFTPDDLLARQIYDHGQKLDSLAIAVGADVPGIRKMIAERFGVPADDVLDKVQIRRLRTERSAGRSRPLGPADLTPETVRDAAHDAALHLARGVGKDGRFRYYFDAASGQPLKGAYSWPRHAGSTWFLAQASSIWPDRSIRDAATRAASVLTNDIVQCGADRCVARDDRASIADSAITIFALVELIETNIDRSHEPLVGELSHFIRAMQRPDGEFMHRYDRKRGQPIDVQEPYTTGEATLGLARAYRITKDPADLKAAAAGLARLVGPNWDFFGNRYYFGEEHWTCQALAELWDDAPDRNALDFCLRWSAYNRVLQLDEGETPYDADGAHGVSPYVTPRIPPVASRAEAAIATLAVARRAGVDATELAALDRQVRRALALVMRHQFRPGPTHLFSDPAGVQGAVPGSEVDWQLRIDYTRHPTGAMLRWAEMEEAKK